MAVFSRGSLGGAEHLCECRHVTREVKVGGAKGPPWSRGGGGCGHGLLLFQPGKHTKRVLEVCSRLVGDHQTSNPKVKARTRDTDFYRFRPPR
jgi:hypothetical protein